MRTGVALGANLGDRLAALCTAQQQIRQLPGVGEPWLNSAVYETEPVGCEAGAKPFLNAVVEFEYDGVPRDLLRGLRAVEASLGRSPDHAPNESRTIDLDLLYADNAQVAADELQLPHPRIASRRFVLQPLADIRPELVLPGFTKSIGDMLAELCDGAPVVRFPQRW